MPFTAAMFTRNFDQVRAHMPHTVTVGSTTKNAVVSGITRTKEDLVAGGHFPDDVFEAHIRVSEWGTLPTIGDRITTSALSGVTFKVQRFETDPSGAVRILYCGGKG